MVKYSFVIPTYQNKLYLRNALEALNNQAGFSGNDYEAIVVDDGSNDDTWSFIQGVNKNYELKYIYLERNKNSCRSRARNYGWRIAEGRYIIFIDADIIVKENHLAELERCFRINSDLVVIGTRFNLPETIPYENIFDEGVLDKYKSFSDRTGLLEDRHYALEMLSYNLSVYRFPWMMVFSCNMALKKEKLQEINGFDENFKKWGAEDIDVGYRLFLKNEKIVINPRLEVFHQYHKSANDGTEESQESTRYLMSKHKGLFMDVPPGQEFHIFRPEILETGKLFRYSKLDDMFRKKQEYQHTEILNFTGKCDINEFKAYILEITHKENYSIIVNDYTEDTDLDIWIQLIEGANSIPEYYPASKRIRKKSSFSVIDRILWDSYK